MTTVHAKPDRLALLGGEAVTPPLPNPAWPPRTQATAQKLAQVYLSGQWSFNGPQEQELCRRFAAFHDAKHGIFMANGTVTLQAALAACGVGPGDEVIVPALTWLATAMACRYLGAVPVFVDIEPTTLCMDMAQAEKAITPRTRAIIPVHLYGGSPDLDAVTALAARHNLVVIEDCAHGHGGKWGGKGFGSIGHIGSFSFQESKSMASGEGGMCITSDDRLAERLFRCKHIGYATGEAKGLAAGQLPSDLVCHNFRGTEFQAAILLDQLSTFKELIATYNANADRLTTRLSSCRNLRVQSRGRRGSPQSYYGFAVIFENALAAVPIDRVFQAVKAEGFPMLWGIYGSVYHHQLWNLPPTDYRILNGACPVSDGMGSRHIGIVPHQWLGSGVATIDLIGEVLAKLDANAQELAASGVS